MADGVNKVILLGNLGRDPEVRTFNDGTQVANISLAVGSSWKDKNSGEKKEKTEWVRVSVFGPLAGIAGQYLRKGSKVYFEGKMETRKYQDQSGQDKYSTEVVVRGFGGEMRMLDPAPQQGQQQQQQQQQAPQQQQAQQQQWHGIAVEPATHWGGQQPQGQPPQQQQQQGQQQGQGQAPLNELEGDLIPFN